MSFDRRSFLKTSAIAAAAAAVVPPLITEVSLAEMTQDTYIPFKPLPPSLIRDITRDLPILLPLMRTNKATPDQYVHYADILAFLAQQLRVCGWDTPCGNTLKKTDLHTVKAGIPSYVDMMYSLAQKYDKSATKEDIAYFTKLTMSSIYDVKKPLTSSNGKALKYTTPYPTVQKGVAHSEVGNTATAVAYLAKNKPKPKTAEAGIITPQYLYVTGCEILDQGSGFFGGLSLMATRIPFLEPMVIPFGLMSFGMYVSYDIFCM